MQLGEINALAVEPEPPAKSCDEKADRDDPPAIVTGRSFDGSMTGGVQRLSLSVSVLAGGLSRPSACLVFPGRSAGVPLTPILRLRASLVSGRGRGRSSAFPRHRAPEFCMISSPMKSEGVGNAGCPMHPQPRVQNGSEHTSIVTARSTGFHPAFPHAMVLTAYFVLSPATNSSCHRHRRIKAMSAPGRADLPPPT